MARVTKTTIQPVTETSKQARAFPAVAVLTILLCGAVIVAGYFYYQYRNAKPGVADTKEIKQLTETIGSFMVLPEGETPTLATVTDKEKLADQPFFQKAENGDKVLIYTNSGRAVLYRPSTGKIVDVTSVNVQTPPAETPAPEIPVITESEAVVTPPSETSEADVLPEEVVDVTTLVATVALYNGSSKVGVTSALETQLNEQFPLLTVAMKEKAVKNDYQGNLIVDLSGKNADLTKKLADSFNGTVGILPVGETAPVADILIIVGNTK